ncbi:MAG: hypothetical protein U0941_29925 [Planctomycetaceae bacterium]
MADEQEDIYKNICPHCLYDIDECSCVSDAIMSAVWDDSSRAKIIGITPTAVILEIAETDR